MQVILKQSEITAALAAYMVNVLGASGVTPETLTVVYKQGRSDKNGMTAELEIEAPHYASLLNAPVTKTEGTIGAVEFIGACAGDSSSGKGLVSGFGVTPPETTSASVAEAQGAAPVEAVNEPASVVPEQVLDSASPIAEPTYEGERRADSREERVAELNDEVAAALAEDEAADAAEVELPDVEETTPVTTAAAPLFG